MRVFQFAYKAEFERQIVQKKRKLRQLRGQSKEDEIRCLFLMIERPAISGTVVSLF